eukprot:Platyproteum_vivax@DN4529_c0_g1_i1.p1
MGDSEAEEKEVQDLSSPVVLTKYRTAADICNEALQELVKKCIVGASAFELCVLGDTLINDKVAPIYNQKKNGKKIEKGVAFPTCLSVNELCGHYSPVKAAEADRVLVAGDVVKIDLGCHIDSFVALAAHTVVVDPSAETVSNSKAAVIKAAWYALDAASKMIKVGAKNSDVTKVIKTVAEEFGVNPLEGVLSHQLKKHVIDGNQVIAQKETADQKVEVFEFEANTVYALDVIFSTGEGKPKESEIRTTVYKRNVEMNYSLKTGKARHFLSDVNRRYPTLPFNLRNFDGETECKLGVSECMRHDLLHAFPVLHEKTGEFVAQFKSTVVILPSGQKRITGLPFEQADKLVCDKEIKDEEIKALLAIDLNKKKKNKKPKEGQVPAQTAAEEA